MDARYYNGEPGPEHNPGRSNGADPLVCMADGCTFSTRSYAGALGHRAAAGAGHTLTTAKAQKLTEAARRMLGGRA